MLQEAKNKEEKDNSPLSTTIDPINSNKAMDLDDELECTEGSEIDAIDKVLATTKTKPKMIRKNIEHYLEERALKRRVHDVFEDELLLID